MNIILSLLPCFPCVSEMIIGPHLNARVSMYYRYQQYLHKPCRCTLPERCTAHFLFAVTFVIFYTFWRASLFRNVMRFTHQVSRPCFYCLLLTTIVTMEQDRFAKRVSHVLV